MKSVITLIFAFICSAAGATAQIPDQIAIDGAPEPLFSNPFMPIARQDAQYAKLRSFLKGACSASWLGFTAAWEIRDSKLYLIQVTANPCSSVPDPVPLGTFFPEAAGPVHATWYSGVLVIPRGKLIEYVHMGYASRYERYLLIKVVDGVVQSQKEVFELSQR